LEIPEGVNPTSNTKNGLAKFLGELILSGFAITSITSNTTLTTGFISSNTRDINHFYNKMFHQTITILTLLIWTHQSVRVNHIRLTPLITYHLPINGCTNNNLTGANIYLSEQYNSPITTAVQIYHWFKDRKHHKLKSLLPTIKDRSSQQMILLLLSGVEPNPGPRKPRFPCTVCQKACKEDTIACDDCDQWMHKTCIGMSTTEFSEIGKSEGTWTCPSCSKKNNSSMKIYHVPSEDNNSSLNISTNPLLLDSISEVSMPSTSGSSIYSPSFSSTSFNSTDIPIMSSSPKPAKPKPTAKKTLRILNINFQSLRKKGKLLETIIDSTDPDVIIGTETWLDPNIKSSEIIPDFQNYDIERRDRPTDPHGGVMLATKKALLLGNINKSSNIELISGTINLEGKKKMLIGSYYRPPDKTNDSYLNQVKEEISNTRWKHKKDLFVIGGDFNLPDINWSEQSITNNQYPSRVNQTFLDIVADNGLEQIVDFSTRKDNILDLMLISHPAFKQRCKPLPSIGNSDHDIVLLDIACKPFKPKPVRRKIYLWKKADIYKIKEDLTIFEDVFKHTFYENIDAMWEAFKTAIQKTIEKRIPTKIAQNRHTHPWINTNIRRKINKKNKAHKKARKTKKKRDKDRYKRLQQEVQRDVRQANRKYMEDISTNYKDNSKKFWSYIKSKGQEWVGVAPLKNSMGFIQSDNKSKAEILNQQFQSVFTKENLHDSPNKGPSPYSSMKDININTKGVHKLLKNLNAHKATGPDSIPSFILKTAANEIAPILTKMFQTSLDTGAVPQDWKDAHVVPLFKKDERHLASNYRPVSLTSITCKVLEHIIHSSIMDHYDQNNILTNAQHGFRKKRSCETQLIITIHEIASKLSKGSQVDIILLDFSKAFDKVPHLRLLHKLEYYGVNKKTNAWIKTFLQDRKQSVILEGTTSSQAPVLSGVPQGTVLGPLLFLTYINDMPEKVTSSETKLFADDSMLFRSIKNQNDSHLLQKDLTSLEDWENKWQMNFNAKKCIVIRIRPLKKELTVPSTYKLHGHTLDIVDSSKYLGVTINNNLTWDRHIDNIVGKGNKTLGFIRRNLKDCTKPVKAAAYTSIVRPSLEYASTIWDPSNQCKIKSIENVQKRAARFVHNNYSDRTPGCVTKMVKSLEWENLADRRQNNRLCMLFKIQHGEVDIDKDQYLIPNDNRTRGKDRFFQERTKHDSYGQSFFPRTIRDWNQLQTQTTSASTVEGFRVALKARSENN